MQRRMLQSSGESRDARSAAVHSVMSNTPGAAKSSEPHPHNADLLTNEMGNAGAPLPPPPETRLSLDAVAAWLAVQDEQTRAVCACIVSDELESVRAAAQAEGVAAGKAEGRRVAQQEADALLSTLHRLVEAAAGALEREQSQLTEQCVDIVAEAFAKVAGEALVSRAAILGAVIDVLKRVRQGHELTVRVSAADLELLQREQERLVAAVPGRKLVLLADPQVGVGGCIVESALGSLDGRLDVKLRELYETLRTAKLMPQGSS